MCAVIQELDCPDEGTEEACVTNCVANGAGPCAAEYAAEVECLAGTEAVDWACDDTAEQETAYSVDVCTTEIDATFDCLAG